MEPLDMMATDWIKDYDPLFELFDEELGGGAASAANDGAFWQASEFLTPSTMTGLNEYDLNQCYQPYKQQQTSSDELSIILGLDWMPCQPPDSEFNSPTESSSSAYSSAAPSPLASTSSSAVCTTSSASSTTSSYSSSSSASSSTSASPTFPSVTTACSRAPTQVKSASKKRKKCPKPRGTSLLAQPSPVKTIVLRIIQRTGNLDRMSKLCVEVEHAYATTLA